QVYLEHINKNNSVDEITYGLLERGTFGFMPYLMLGILHNEKEISEFNLLEQNEMIEELIPLNPIEVERLVKNSSLNTGKAKAIMQELMISDKEDILKVLGKLSKGA